MVEQLAPWSARNTYTIMSVNPGADSFTVFLNGWRFVNNGATITDGIGFMACAG